MFQKVQKMYWFLFSKKRMSAWRRCRREYDHFFKGEYLKTAWMCDEEGKLLLLTGIGKTEEDKLCRKEIAAKAVKECRSKKINGISMDIGHILCEYGVEAVRDLTEGAVLGAYTQKRFSLDKAEKEREAAEIEFFRYSP